MKILAQIESDKDSTEYQIRVGDDFRTYCTCPAWKFNKADPKRCKHLDRFMCGEFDFVGTVAANRQVSQEDGFSLRALLLD
tara:strand:+ start:349 stop:591 length:243 start_codon:yes stop_codon:yes gene_type:complete